ncbi:MAG: CARDB domain-containing protein [bacterium]|nr:CARDB domain-containing protein [bacterium]
MKNKKSLLVILGTVVLAVVAIFTAWKLSQPGPVAPTAPKQVPAQTINWGDYASIPSFSLIPGAPAAPTTAPAPAAAPTGAACGSAYPQGCPTGHVCTNQQCVVPSSTTTTPATSKDLAPLEFSFNSADLVEGRTVTFTSGVQNLGDADTTAFNVLWRVDGNDKSLRGHPGILAKTTAQTGESQFSWVAQAGEHKIGFVVDSDKMISESNEFNNEFSKYVTVAAAPSGGTTTQTTSPLSPASAPTCGDTKPGSAPTITSATASTNTVTLRWTKASDPVTHYFVVYGTSSGQDQFGSTNIGNKDTTSYQVKSLSGGKTYYFRIAAVNGCMPGNYSNEISAKPSGGTLTGTAEGFTTVTGTTAVAPTKTTTTTATPSAQLPVSGVNTPTVAVGIGGMLLLLLGLGLAFNPRRRTISS